ncbi:MAG: hypothetical protein ABIS84_12385 [Arachnia sp.]
MSDPSLPELRLLRDELGSWRFYDALRVDSDSPAWQPRVGTHNWWW